jgi:YD repeat-containing protein
LQRLNFAAGFDSSGRVQRLQLPSGTIQYSHDPGSRLTTVVDRRRLISRFFQNEDGITTRVVNALGEETAIALDAGRNATSLARNGSVIETMQYDSEHRLIFRQSSTDSGNLDRQYTYDRSTGLLSKIHASSGNDQIFAYDAQGNLAGASLPEGVHSFSFSTVGDLNSFSDQTSNLTFSSDADGLIASMTDGANTGTTFQYQAGAQLASALLPGWGLATYEYQPSGLRSKMSYKNGSRVEYDYDPAGNLTRTKVFDANGKQINGQTLEMNCSYQLVRWVLFDKTETTFRYDPNGNLTEIKKGSATTKFEFDALDRLTAVITPTHQRLTYRYKPGERSLIEQYQHAAIGIADLRDTGLTFADTFTAVTLRPLTTPLGAVRFSESLGAFQLANADGSEIVRPQEAIEGALAKLYLSQAGMTRKALRSGFGAPFNAMFIPAEYLTINCCPECYFDGEEWYCPPCSGGGDPQPPTISEIDPDSIMIGSNNVQITIHGTNFGSDPTVNLPQGVTNLNSGGNSDTSIVITVNVTFNATIGTNTLNVINNDTGLGSDDAGFTVDGPNEAVVQNDVIGTSTRNPNRQSRFVTYEVMNASGTQAQGIPVAEVVSQSGYNCQQSDSGFTSTQCNGTSHTSNTGIMTDEWSMYTGFTPAGCGVNITDFWQWCGPTAPAPTPGITFMTLNGFIHTSNSEINTYINPPTPIPQGTIFHP